MKRNIDLSEISDGKLYTAEDLVRADCHDCQGCSACCHGMGNSIILDPMDIWRLSRGTGMNFDGLVNGGYVELGIVDGMILPNIRMNEDTETCGFLDQNGRCSIHGYRPGICRLFPLGRYYEKEGFRYFLQIYECRKKDRGKIKIKKWLGIPNLKAYEAYILSWHDFLEKCREGADTLDEEKRRTLALYVLRRFYELPYYADSEENFYAEFAQRLTESEEKLGL